jgi:hypothetical protein
MRFTTLLMLAASSALLTGCASTVSIHPLYTSQDLVSDLPIEGTWTEQDGEIWQVQKSGDGYDVTVLHTGDTPSTEAFNVHTLRLKNADYVDATSKSQPDLGIAGHLLGKIEVQGDEMRVTLLNDDWLKKTMQAGLAPPSVTGEDKRIILTAPTSDLQRFVTMHAADADAWDAEASTFHRVR